MKLEADAFLCFDYHLPIYNWYYPIHATRSRREGMSDNAAFGRLSTADVTSRAMYLHVPFCETICSFCPFERAGYRDSGIIDRYVQALLCELRAKSEFRTVRDVPIGAIFIGGGTPSLLEPHHIRMLGEALHSEYDLSQLNEFSFEFEVKSITDDRVDALRDIGVSHARFGLQTFSPRYRKLFSLSATLEHVQRALELLPRSFPFVSFDMLYGMNGQTTEEVLIDAVAAATSGVANIDYYSINNVVTQRKLHRWFREQGLEPTSALAKLGMRVMADRTLRSHGFRPHNGHGYVRAPQISADCVVTDAYSFRYHEYVYGYSDMELIGFGNGAISSFNGFTVRNVESRDRYMEAWSAPGKTTHTVGVHAAGADASKPVVTRLPYHGVLDGSRVDWTNVRSTTVSALIELLDAGLVLEDGKDLRLSAQGWLWYVNLMYFLSSPEEKAQIDRIVEVARSDGARDVEELATVAQAVQ